MPRKASVVDTREVVPTSMDTESVCEVVPADLDEVGEPQEERGRRGGIPRRAYHCSLTGNPSAVVEAGSEDEARRRYFERIGVVASDHPVTVTLAEPSDADGA